MDYSALYVGGEYAMMVSYPNQRVYQQWLAEVRGIKDRNDAINNDGQAGAARVPKYNAWLVLVKQFIDRWGEAFLPPDIKHAVNSVERGIEIGVTVWQDPPENHLFNDYVRRT